MTAPEIRHAQQTRQLPEKLLRGFVFRAAAILLVLCLGLLPGQGFCQVLTGATARSFSAVLPGVSQKSFHELRILKEEMLQQTYDTTRDKIDALRADKKRYSWRQPWEQLRDVFVSIALSNPGPVLGAQALYRAAECQEELAGHSRLAADARLAVSLYEAVVRRHPQSVRADDALLGCARLADGRLKDKTRAAAYIQRILREYPGSDSAAAARTIADGKTAGQAGTKEKTPARAAQPPLTITLDPGHGGQDPGTMHNGLVEREVTLDVALRLGRILEANGVKVLYTRKTDRTVSLAERTALANTKGSDLYLSIHVNANQDTSINGVEVYYLDTSPSAPTMVAKRENGSKAKVRPAAATSQKVAAGRVLASRKLAGIVHRSLHGSVVSHGYKVGSKGVRKAPFYVLAAASMPSVLAEIGYCTNEAEARLLKTDKYRQAVAQGLAEGILAWRAGSMGSVTADMGGMNAR